MSFTILLIGTNLSFLPFPNILIKKSSKKISDIFKLVNSETLNPQLYKTSNIVQFLKLFFLDFFK